MSQEDDFFWEKREDIKWEEVFKKMEKKGGKIKISKLAEFLESYLDRDYFKSQYLHIIKIEAESGKLKIDKENENIRKNKVWLPKEEKKESVDQKSNTGKQADFSEF